MPIAGIPILNKAVGNARAASRGSSKRFISQLWRLNSVQGEILKEFMVLSAIPTCLNSVLKLV